MHKSAINPVIRARYRAMKGGKEFAFAALDPRRTAHLVIDMQNGFVEEGSFLEVPEARNVVPNINAISKAIRSKEGMNLFLRFTTTSKSDWSVYFEQFQSEEFSTVEVDGFMAGNHGHALYPTLEVMQEDQILNKTRFSAFTPGSSSALELLKSKGIDTVLISGTLSDCCCAATARDAQQLGFRVIFVSDSNAALSDDEHNAAINSLAAWFADIRTTAEVVQLVLQSEDAVKKTDRTG